MQPASQGEESKPPRTRPLVPMAGPRSPPSSSGGFAEVITGLSGTTQGREGRGLLARLDPRTFAAQEQPTLIKAEGGRHEPRSTVSRSPATKTRRFRGQVRATAEQPALPGRGRGEAREMAAKWSFPPAGDLQRSPGMAQQAGFLLRATAWGAHITRESTWSYLELVEMGMHEVLHHPLHRDKVPGASMGQGWSHPPMWCSKRLLMARHSCEEAEKPQARATGPKCLKKPRN